MPKNEDYKYTITYKPADEAEFLKQDFKTMLGAKAFFDFVAGDPAIVAAFLWDNEAVKIIKRSVK